MTPLFERYRPATLDDVVGQPKAVAAVRSIVERGGFGGRSVWLSGASGTGKTTLARIIAGTVAGPFGVVEYDSADDVDAAEVEAIRRTMGTYGLDGGRAWIVNEAHGLRAPVIRRLLGVLERLPPHVVMVFTTTMEGESVFEDQIDSAPLFSRCVRIKLTNQGLAQAFAERVRAIAQAEHLDGRPIAEYVKLAQRCRNNCRAMLSEVESGAMLGGGE